MKNKALIPCASMALAFFFGGTALGLSMEAALFIAFLAPPALYLVGALGMDRFKEHRERMKLQANVM